MTEDSGFFTDRAALTGQVPEWELIHRSACGWSELYKVSRDGRYFVLKALKPEFRGRALYESLLDKEFRIGSSLSHPGICEVYRFFLHPGLGHVIKLEWIDGDTLDKVLPLSGSAALRLADQLCDAVGYLHSHQILHRDIKLTNLMVTRSGKNLKMIDFGLSDSDSWYSLKGPAGTGSYAAPEVLAGLNADARSDIWSLGKVLWELLPGKRGVARRCMASDPSRRYQSADEVKAALHRRPWFVWLAVALVVIAVVAVTFRSHGLTVESPADAVDTVVVKESPAVSDPAVIDELFRQATEIIEAK